MLRLRGSRTGRLVALALTAALVVFFFFAWQRWARYAASGVAPALLQALGAALDREVAVGEIVVDQPGLALLREVRISRGKSLANGDWIFAREVELSYDPSLLSWQSLRQRLVNWDSRARIAIRDLVLATDAPHSPQEVARAPLVEMDVDLAPLLQRRPASELLATVRQIRLVNPVVVAARGNDNRWSVERFWTQPPGDRDAGFRGEIVIENGTVLVTDSGGIRRRTPVHFRSRFSAVLRTAAYPLVSVTGAGAVSPRDVRFRATGWYDLKRQRLMTTVDAGTASPEFWMRYLGMQGDAMLVREGRVRVRGFISGVRSRLAFEGRVSGTDLVVRAPELPSAVRLDEAELQVTGDRSTFSGRGRFEGSAVNASGSLQGDALQDLTARVQVRGARFDRILKLLPRGARARIKLPSGFRIHGGLTGEVVAQARRGGSGLNWWINGNLGAPSATAAGVTLNKPVVTVGGRITPGGQGNFTGTLAAASALYERISLSSPRASFKLRGDLLQSSFTARVAGGRIEGEAWLASIRRPGKIYSVVRAEGLAAPMVLRLARRTDLPLEGEVSGRLVVSGTLDAPEVAARLRLTGGRWAETLLPPVDAQLLLGDETLIVEHLQASDRRGALAARGTVTQEGAIALEWEVRGLRLAETVRRVGDDLIAGSVDARGRVTGIWPDVVAVGEATASPVVLGDQRASQARARFTWTNPNRLELTDLAARIPPAELTAPRLVLDRENDEAPWEIAGRVTVRRMPFSQLLSLAGAAARRERMELAGEIEEATLVLSGAAQEPLILVSGTVVDLAAPRLRADRAELQGEIDLARGTLRATLIELEGGPTALAAEVTADLVRDDARWSLANLRAAATTGQLDAAQLLSSLAPDLADWLHIAGDLGGVEAAFAGGTDLAALRSGDATLRVGRSELRLNGAPLVLEPFTLEARAGLVTVARLEGRLGDAPFRIDRLAYLMPPDADRARRALDRLAADIRVQELSVDLLLDMVERSPSALELLPDRLWQFVDQLERPTGHRVSLDLQTRMVLAADELPPAALPADRIRGPSETAITARISGAGARRTGQTAVSLPLEWKLTGRIRSGVAVVDEATAAWSDGASGTLRGQYVFSTTPQTVDLDVQVLGIKVERLLPLFGEIPTTLRPLSGLLSGSLKVTGAAEQPAVRGDGELVQATIGGVRVTSLEFQGGSLTAVPGGWSLAMPRVVAERELGPNDAMRVTGSLSLPLTSAFAMDPARPRRILLRLPEQRIASLREVLAERRAALQSVADLDTEAPLLDLLLSAVTEVDGVIEGGVELAGTLQRPVNAGNVRIAVDRLELKGMDTALTGIAAQLRLAADRVIVEELTAVSTAPGGGQLSLSGSVRLATVNTPANLDLKLLLDGFNVRQDELSRIVPALGPSPARAVLTSVNPALPGVTAPLSITGDPVRPLIAGGIRLDGALIEPNLSVAQLPDAASPVPQVDPRLDLVLLSGDPIRVANRLLRATGEGRVRLSGPLSQLQAQGRLNVTDGRIDLPTYPLRRLRGEVRIAYDAATAAFEPGLPVYLDLEAQAPPEHLQRSVLEPPETYEVTVYIRGRPGLEGESLLDPAVAPGGLLASGGGGLTIVVRSDPPLPGGRVEALIRQRLGLEGIGPGGANVESALGSQLQLALSSSLGSVLTRPVEDWLRSGLGLEFASIQIGLEQRLRIQVGKRIFGKLYGTLTQTVGTGGGQAGGGLPYQSRIYEIYYRLSPRLRVGYRYLEPFPRDHQVFVSGSFSF